MKRSGINEVIRETEKFFSDHEFRLPGWSAWRPSAWEGRLDACREIFECGLGWDVTDFGSGDFLRRGLVLFTLRNGRVGTYEKPYAEKIMMVRENQETPFHFHWHKMEDIINRGGGKLAFELFRSTPGGDFSGEAFDVKLDGVRERIAPGETIVLEPGCSLTLEPRVYHRFYALGGHGPVLCGEVSMVNDDHADNRFKETIGRFPGIEEDEEPLRLLVGDYGRFP